MKRLFKLRVNGELFEIETHAHRTLLDVLRDELNLTGTKKGCDRGECGACTVIIDGDPVNSCLVLIPDADQKEIQTIEGLVRDGNLHPLQKAFVNHGAIQCGFCTPGMILAAKALLDKNPRPTPLEMKEAVSGNLCRCTGYAKILEAIGSVAKGSEGWDE
jgi:carbon-monoxide dehydrogenase small subunit